MKKKMKITYNLIYLLRSGYGMISGCSESKSLCQCAEEGPLSGAQSSISRKHLPKACPSDL